MVIGPISKLTFDGVLDTRTAFQIGRFMTMAHFLNARADSAWVFHPDIKVVFRITHEDEFNAYHVFIGLENISRIVEYEIGTFTDKEDCNKLINLCQEFMKSNVI